MNHLLSDLISETITHYSKLGFNSHLYYLKSFHKYKLPSLFHKKSTVNLNLPKSYESTLLFTSKKAGNLNLPKKLWIYLKILWNPVEMKESRAEMPSSRYTEQIQSFPSTSLSYTVLVARWVLLSSPICTFKTVFDRKHTNRSHKRSPKNDHTH